MSNPKETPEIEELRENPQKRGVSIVSLLENNNVDLDKQTLDLLSEAIKDNPELSTVEVSFVSGEEEPNTVGFFDRVKIDEHTFIPTIFIVKEDGKHMERIMRVRKFSNKIVANMLGITLDKLTPAILKRFIILHELGHARDFINNYQNNPDYHGKDVSEEWETDYRSSLYSLPVAGLDPAELFEEVSRFKSLEDFLNQHPEVLKRIDQGKIKTVDDLLEAQESSYRASPYETYADNFAINYLKVEAAN